MLSVPTPLCTRVRVTVGSVIVRIVRLPACTRSSVRTRRGGSAADAGGALGAVPPPSRSSEEPPGAGSAVLSKSSELLVEGVGAGAVAAAGSSRSSSEPVDAGGAGAGGLDGGELAVESRSRLLLAGSGSDAAPRSARAAGAGSADGAGSGAGRGPRRVRKSVTSAPDAGVEEALAERVGRGPPPEMNAATAELASCCGTASDSCVVVGRLRRRR